MLPSRTARHRSRHRRGPLLTVALLGAVVAACGSDADVRSGDAGSATTAGTTTATTSPPTTIATTTTSPPTTVAETTTTEPPTTPPTTEPPTTDALLDCVALADLPPLVAAEADGYDTVGVHEGLGGSVGTDLALFTAGAAVAVQVDDGDHFSVEYRIGPEGGIGPNGTIDNALLHDLVVTPTGPAVLYGEIYQGDGEPLAYLNLLDIGTGAITTITESQGIEYYVFRAAVADGIVVTSAVADLSESINTWALDGSGAIERYSPVLAEKYGLAPFYGPAVPSPDGTRLAWLEGPDVVGDSTEPEGDWQFVVADAVTGEVELRMFLGDTDETFEWLDWDGEWAVLSRGHGLPVTAVNTSEPDDYPKDICGEAPDGLLTGIATFVIT